MNALESSISRYKSVKKIRNAASKACELVMTAAHNEELLSLQKDIINEQRKQNISDSELRKMLK